jgi:GNAT superfamily N-acetyltransferase
MITQDQNTYEPLSSSGDPSFEEFYEIYTESIPASERKGREKIAAMCGRPDYQILLVKRAGRVIGFTVVFRPGDQTFCLLEYMAIHRDFRNSGVGTALFHRAFTAASAGDRSMTMLMEVDADSQPDPDQALKQRRAQFYRRLGCLRVDGLAYILPLRSPDKPPLPPIFLWVYSPQGLGTIQKTDLRHWLSVLYERVYLASPQDPRIEQMLAPLSDPIRFT